MNKVNGSINQIKIGLVIGVLTALTGCAMYGGGGYYGDGVVVSDPDAYLFGGGYDNGRDVRNYSHRGSESHGATHSGGSHEAAHTSNGNGERR